MAGCHILRTAASFGPPPILIPGLRLRITPSPQDSVIGPYVCVVVPLAIHPYPCVK